MTAKAAKLIQKNTIINFFKGETIINGSQTAGYKTIQWNATNNLGEPVSAGLYLYTIEAGEFRQAKKMVLLK